jgi:hypothetical protein
VNIIRLSRSIVWFSDLTWMRSNVVALGNVMWRRIWQMEVNSKWYYWNRQAPAWIRLNDNVLLTFAKTLRFVYLYFTFGIKIWCCSSIFIWYVIARNNVVERFSVWLSSSCLSTEEDGLAQTTLLWICEMKHGQIIIMVFLDWPAIHVTQCLQSG